MLGFEIHPLLRLMFWVAAILVVCYLIGWSPVGIIQHATQSAQHMHNCMVTHSC